MVPSPLPLSLRARPFHGGRGLRAKATVRMQSSEAFQAIGLG